MRHALINVNALHRAPPRLPRGLRAGRALSRSFRQSDSRRSAQARVRKALESLRPRTYQPLPHVDVLDTLCTVESSCSVCVSIYKKRPLCLIYKSLREVPSKSPFGNVPSVRSARARLARSARATGTAPRAAVRGGRPRSLPPVSEMIVPCLFCLAMPDHYSRACAILLGCCTIMIAGLAAHGHPRFGRTDAT